MFQSLELLGFQGSGGLKTHSRPCLLQAPVTSSLKEAVQPDPKKARKPYALNHKPSKSRIHSRLSVLFVFFCTFGSEVSYFGGRPGYYPLPLEVTLRRLWFR